MRIGVDGRELSGQPTGVGRYLQRLLREWGLSAEARAHQFTIYSPDAGIALPPDLSGEVVRVPGAGGTRWEQGALAAVVRRDRPDVFFAPGYGGPLLTSVPLVVVDARRFVCRSPGVVPSAGRLAAASHGAGGRTASEGGPHGLGVLPRRDRPIPGRSGRSRPRDPAWGRYPRGADPCRAIRWYCSSGRSSTGVTCRCSCRHSRSSPGTSPACGSNWSAATVRIRGRTSALWPARPASRTASASATCSPTPT